MKGQETLFPHFLVEGTRTVLGEDKVLIWGDDVSERVDKRARYHATRFNNTQEEREDFIQECQLLVFRRCRDRKLQGYAAIESTVRNFAIDFFVRAGSRKPKTAHEDEEDGRIEREPDTKGEIDHSLSILLEDFPLLSCVELLRSEGVDIDTIATAFGWDTHSLADAVESDRKRAHDAFIGELPR